MFAKLRSAKNIYLLKYFCQIFMSPRYFCLMPEQIGISEYATTLANAEVTKQIDKLVVGSRFV